MSAEEIANSFVQHYYAAFDSNPDNLRGLFTDQSMMTFEGTLVQGGEAIVAKIKSIGRIQHQTKTIDVQPSNVPTAIQVFVTGAVLMGDSMNPVHFCEYFQLIATQNNSFYVHNGIFRMNYGL